MCDLSGDGPHLTPTLSFQEREPVSACSTIDCATEEFALLARIDTLLAGGARWVWFRERDMASGPREILARTTMERVRAGGGTFSLGGDASLAARLGADGVHLPGGTTLEEIGQARRLLPNGLIGVSTHSVAEVETAARHGADYATLSPIFATVSKPGYGPALGPEAIAAAHVHGLPVLALGGITPETAHACCEAGAAGIAVMGDLMRGSDPGPTLRALLSV
nr:thiamine phosphate synthase [Methylobacterium gossipiicola]